MGLQVIIAYVVDLLVGDPATVPHPVVLVGKAIARTESRARRLATTPITLKLAGIIIVVVIVGGSYGITYLLVKLASLIHPFLASAVGVWLIATTIAPRGLARAAKGIYVSLAAGQLHAARYKVGQVVGRDTDQMNSTDVARATVETVAENTVDAVVAPLFYAFVGGPPGAMAYRAANTLDSMLGYKHEHYLHLGWAAAKLDDVLNFIPARITGLFMLVAVWLTGRDYRRGYKVLLRDAGRHPSPNAGIPEAVVAGALRIRLGGLNYYRGEPSFREYLYPEGNEAQPNHIRPAVDLMFLSSFLFVITGGLSYIVLT